MNQSKKFNKWRNKNPEKYIGNKEMENKLNKFNFNLKKDDINILSLSFIDILNKNKMDDNKNNENINSRTK